MACTDGGPSCQFNDHITLAKHKEVLDEKQHQLDYVTDMLCRVMTFAEKPTMPVTAGGLIDRVLELHPGLPKWWSDHKQKDEKRKALAAAELKVKQAMQELERLRKE